MTFYIQAVLSGLVSFMEAKDLVFYFFQANLITVFAMCAAAVASGFSNGLSLYNMTVMTDLIVLLSYPVGCVIFPMAIDGRWKDVGRVVTAMCKGIGGILWLAIMANILRSVF